MQGTVQKVTELIDHLRKESLNEQQKCFYCKGAHKTVDCDSPQRSAFHLSLAAIAAETRDMDFEQEPQQYGSRTFTERKNPLHMYESWEDLAF